MKLMKINRKPPFVARYAIGVLVSIGWPICIFADPFLLSLEMKVVVLDESGDLLDGAIVDVGFENTSRQEKTKGHRYTYKKGTHKASESPLVFRNRSSDRITLDVSREGYWASGRGYQWSSSEDQDELSGEYSKEFRIVLKKKVNPRALFTTRFGVHFPKESAPLGYDLEISDWVAPHGRGKHTDFLLTAKRGPIGQYDFVGNVAITFPTPFDGLIPVEETDHQSQLLLGRVAPEAGYVNSFKMLVGTRPESPSVDADKGVYTREAVGALEGFWFRTRTQVDEKTGEIQSARYGKIEGPIKFDSVRPSGKPLGVGFTYYFAPDDSRSIEFNGKSLIENADLQGVKKF